MSKRFIYLSNSFYERHPITEFPEIEGKVNRPYIQVCVLINEIQYAIPLRSNINHPHVFWTDRENKCGVDFSKAVVIESRDYIDESRIPQLRQNEFNALKGQDNVIKRRFMIYIRKYQKAKQNLKDSRNHALVSYSTLQYYEKYLPNTRSR